MPVLVRRRAVEVVGMPRTADGVMTLRVRTRVAGALSVRVDSRSQTVEGPGRIEAAARSRPGHDRAARAAHAAPQAEAGPTTLRVSACAGSCWCRRSRRVRPPRARRRAPCARSRTRAPPAAGARPDRTSAARPRRRPAAGRRYEQALEERVDRGIAAVAVDVGDGRDEAADLDLDAGLLAQLAPHALLERLARRNEAARHVPEAEERLDARRASSTRPSASSRIAPAVGFGFR